MQKRKTFDLGLVPGLNENRYHFMGLRDESFAVTVPVLLSTQGEQLLTQQDRETVLLPPLIKLDGGQRTKTGRIDKRSL